MAGEPDLAQGFEAFLIKHRALEEENRTLHEALNAIAVHLRAVNDITAKFFCELRSTPDIFSQKVEMVKLPTGLKHYIFENMGRETIRDVVSWTENHYETEPLKEGKQRIGKHGIAKLIRFLRTQGLWLGMTEDQIRSWTPPHPSEPLFPRR